MKSCGFTLIELRVVIASLAAMLLPALAKATSKVMLTVDLNIKNKSDWPTPCIQQATITNTSCNVISIREL